MIGPIRNMAAGFTARIRAAIAGLYGIYPAGPVPSNGQSYGGFEIRPKRQQVSDTSYATIFHNGTDLIITTASAGIKIQSNTGSRYLDIRTGAHPTISSLQVDATFNTFGYSGGGNFSHVAANVIGMSSGHWFQNGGRTLLTANATNATTTLGTTGAAISGLRNGRRYSGRFKLFLENATSGDGIKLDLNGGTGTWSAFRAAYIAYDDSGLSPVGKAVVTSLSTEFSIASFTTGWVDIEWAGTHSGSNGSTLLPRFAKNSNAAGAALTLYANSFGWAEDMP